MRTIPAHIESDRLILRRYEPSDAHAMFEAVDSSRDTLTPWLPWAEQGHRSVEDSRAYIHSALERFDHGTDFALGIFRREDGLFLGGTGIHRFDWQFRRFEIGYWLRSDVTGKGYATESTWRLTRLAFEDLAAERVEIRVEPDNRASRAIPERLGFQNEGTLRRVGVFAHRWRDHVMYSMIRPEFEPRAERP